VTLLKPLCGLEPELYEGLRSFCAQDYSELQIIFGARSPEDPALQVAGRLAAEFPLRDMRIVAGAPVLEPNLKVANLAHMLGAARHDLLVIAVLLSAAWPWASALLAVALILRYLLHFIVHRRLRIARIPLLLAAWLMPLCDFLAFGVWMGEAS